MLDQSIRAKYMPTIGIECHVQLKTASKLFSAAGNDAREAPPNTLVSHIDFGLPGSLPVLNAEAVELAARAAFALNATPSPFSKFDRKHYFYPDLPMGYQITQFDEPIILGGSVNIEIEGQVKTIGITRAHMEADAGKSIHPVGADYSLIDLNRAGTPLLEIVSEPDMHSAAEARAYVRELYLRMRYARVSDCNLYYGNMRFDVNVSVSQNDELGIRSETKNLNSFRAVEKTIEFEINRQIERLEHGERIIQETRGWDDAKQRTFTQRVKENADDYRYMPDPDLPPIVLSEEFIENVRTQMPLMPDDWRARFHSLGMDKAQTETLLDAEVELDQQHYLELLEAALDEPELARQIANWLVNIDIPYLRERSAGHVIDRLTLYKAVAALIGAGELSSTNAKQLIISLLGQPELPLDIRAYAEQKGFIQLSDETEIAEIIEQVLGEYPAAAADVKNGELKAIGFLVGQVMKRSQGKANPQLAQRLIRKNLGLSDR